jgi:hypothetical protein
MVCEIVRTCGFDAEPDSPVAAVDSSRAPKVFDVSRISIYNIK